MASSDFLRHISAMAKEKPTPGTLPSLPPAPVEKGGPQGPEPTRYGDWERDGKCVDF